MDPDGPEYEASLRRSIRKHARRLFKFMAIETERNLDVPSVILANEATELFRDVNQLLLLRSARLSNEVKRLREQQPNDGKE